MEASRTLDVKYNRYQTTANTGRSHFIFHLCMISFNFVPFQVHAYIWFVFDIDNTLIAPRFPRRTLITGAHRRQFPLAPNLSSGGVARSRRRGAGGRATGRASGTPHAAAAPRSASAPLIVRAGCRRHATYMPSDTRCT